MSRSKISFTATITQSGHSQNLSTGSEGSISVIISSSIDGLAFMPRFRYFKAHHPTISLTVRISSPRYMVDQLKRGEADIAICWPEEMQQNDDIFVQNLAEFKGCLVCRSDHPLASCRSITPEKLQDAQFSIVDLAGMPNTYRAHCRDWKRLGLPIPSEAPVFDKVNRVEEILFSVIMNNYLAILPEYVKKQLHRRSGVFAAGAVKPSNVHGFLRLHDQQPQSGTSNCARCPA